MGFSNGCAEFALKNPPPFVPSCLIAICDAAGPIRPRVTFCVTVRPLRPSAATVGVELRLLVFDRFHHRRSRIAEKVCTTPCVTSTTASTTDNGSRMYEHAASCRPSSCRSSSRSRPRAARPRNHHRDPRRGGHEVLHPQPDHLRQIRHRARRRTPASWCWSRS